MDQPQKRPLIAGFGFGMTSGVITTLGLIIGLETATQSIAAVVGGILTVAVTDAFSDSLGMHVSEEFSSAGNKSAWRATISTFLSKLLIALSFLVPFVVLDSSAALTVCVVWGLLVIGTVSYFLAKRERKPAWEIVGEHIAIALAVIVITRLIGLGIEHFFKT